MGWEERVLWIRLVVKLTSGTDAKGGVTSFGPRSSVSLVERLLRGRAGMRGLATRPLGRGGRHGVT